MLAASRFLLFVQRKYYDYSENTVKTDYDRHTAYVVNL